MVATSNERIRLIEAFEQGGDIRLRRALAPAERRELLDDGAGHGGWSRDDRGESDATLQGGAERELQGRRRHRRAAETDHHPARHASPRDSEAGLRGDRSSLKAYHNDRADGIGGDGETERPPGPGRRPATSVAHHDHLRLLAEERGDGSADDVSGADGDVGCDDTSAPYRLLEQRIGVLLQSRVAGRSTLVRAHEFRLGVDDGSPRERTAASVAAPPRLVPGGAPVGPDEDRCPIAHLRWHLHDVLKRSGGQHHGDSPVILGRRRRSGGPTLVSRTGVHVPRVWSVMGVVSPLAQASRGGRAGGLSVTTARASVVVREDQRERCDARGGSALHRACQRRAAVSRTTLVARARFRCAERDSDEVPSRHPRSRHRRRRRPAVGHGGTLAGVVVQEGRLRSHRLMNRGSTRSRPPAVSPMPRSAAAARADPIADRVRSEPSTPTTT